MLIVSLIVTLLNPYVMVSSATTTPDQPALYFQPDINNID
ncbi:hypothetical protein AOR13_3646 [Alteromonas stellipolaris LMG 21856]|nr:hypothetical protein AOR13_3646 [Alteromonas stellipolaris LMG 21856]